MLTTFYFLLIIKVHQMTFNKYVLVGLLFIFLFSCTKTENNPQAIPAYSSKFIHTDSLQLIPEKGLVYFKNKLFTGTSVSYYENRNKAICIDYVKGKKHGFQRQWFPDETLSFESEYQNGKQKGLTKSWWKNGKQRSESTFKNGIAHGAQLQWYKSGAKFKHRNLVFGKEEGMQKSWRENGKLYNNYEAKNGRIFGLKRATLCYELDDEQFQLKD